MMLALVAQTCDVVDICLRWRSALSNKFNNFLRKLQTSRPPWTRRAARNACLTVEANWPLKHWRITGNFKTRKKLLKRKANCAAGLLAIARLADFTAAMTGHILKSSMD